MMPRKPKRGLVVAGGLLLIAAAVVIMAGQRSTGTAGRDAPPCDNYKWAWYDISIGDVRFTVGVPLHNIPAPYDKPFFDLRTPVSATLTGVATKRHIETRDDYERLWTLSESWVIDGSSQDRDFIEGELTEWSDIIKRFNSIINEPWVPESVSIIGVFYAALPSGMPFAEVYFLTTHTIADQTKLGTMTNSFVNIDGQWLHVHDDYDYDKTRHPFHRALLMSGRSALLECRRRAGVEPYEALLGDDH